MQNKQIKRCQTQQGVVMPCGELSSIEGKAQKGGVKPSITHNEWSSLVDKSLEGVVKLDKAHDEVVKHSGYSSGKSVEARWVTHMKRVVKSGG